MESYYLVDPPLNAGLQSSLQVPHTEVQMSLSLRILVFAQYLIFSNFNLLNPPLLTDTLYIAQNLSHSKRLAYTHGPSRVKRQRRLKHRLSFLDLPPEIRNKIYCLVLPSGHVLEVQQMHPRGYRASKDAREPLSRTVYAAQDECPGPHSAPLQDLLYGHDVFNYVPPDVGNTTYTSSPHAPWDSKSLKLLVLNHQIRQEAAPIFYGQNDFYFTSMSSIIPFLGDRTPQTRNYIRSLQLDLNVCIHNWYASFVEHCRADAWKRAFTALSKLPHLNLKRLCLRLDEYESSIYQDGLQLHTPQMAWLRKLGKINTLDSLGVEYTPAAKRSDHVDETNPTSDELWDFLAPRMLRKVHGEDHNAESLRHRQIPMTHFGPPRPWTRYSREQPLALQPSGATILKESVPLASSRNRIPLTGW